MNDPANVSREAVLQTLREFYGHYGLSHACIGDISSAIRALPPAPAPGAGREAAIDAAVRFVGSEYALARKRSVRVRAIIAYYEAELARGLALSAVPPSDSAFCDVCGETHEGVCD